MGRTVTAFVHASLATEVWCCARCRGPMFTPPALNRQDSSSGNTPGLVSMVVDEAIHEGFGPAKHTTYRLTTTLVKTSSTSTCRKRFSHFIALRATMVESSPGLVIPPLPEKSVMNRFESDFVENRRLMLEVFLQRVVNHPVAVLLPALAQFLGWKEDICTIVNAEMGSFILPQPQARRPQPSHARVPESPKPAQACSPQRWRLDLTEPGPCAGAGRWRRSPQGRARAGQAPGAVHHHGAHSAQANPDPITLTLAPTLTPSLTPSLTLTRCARCSSG